MRVEAKKIYLKKKYLQKKQQHAETDDVDSEIQSDQYNPNPVNLSPALVPEQHLTQEESHQNFASNYEDSVPVNKSSSKKKRMVTFEKENPSIIDDVRNYSIEDDPLDNSISPQPYEPNINLGNVQPNGGKTPLPSTFLGAPITPYVPYYWP